ncbi:hypothetical protein [Mycobacteroides abscessus]|uniref:hypothetical protein n=1 Tax=Mycobacteroides abscessus TaxID=36809 RepID=UPI001F20FC29|nr:hypothetical protein [Mycobacteroides abscessus]
MTPQPDIIMPADPYGLLGTNWPKESESAYRAAETRADDAATTATMQAQSAMDAETKMADEEGQTAEAVSSGYSTAASTLREHAITFTTIAAWMTDAAGKVGKAKAQMSGLVNMGTSEIRDAITSEMQGITVSPSSGELTTQYQSEITSIASKLNIDLDGIGHSLRGDAGSSTTPTYIRAASTPTAPTVKQSVHHGITGEGQSPTVEPQHLPEMPRVSTPSTPESPSATSTPAPTASPHTVNPTLSNLILGSGPSGAPASPSTSSAKSPSTPASAPAGQAHQSPEQRQQIRPTGLPRIPSIGLPNIPIAAAESITTAVTSSVGHQLPTAPSTPGSSIPASTGITPGVSGTPPALPTPPAGLAPIGGGLPTSPVTQATPVAQATPTAPAPGVQAPSAPQQSTPAPRGPVADIGWLQRTYGLSPSLDLAKSENTAIPALFVTDLPEHEAYLHRALASLRHAFEQAGWGQPLAVGLIKRGWEARTVYATSDGLSIHPAGVLLPEGVTPIDEMPSTPNAPELSGSIRVTDKLTSLIPRGWTVEGVLSTVSGGEGSQSAEEFQPLVESGELLPCTVSRGRADVEAEEALRVFARASIGSRGCGGLDVESARLRSARWVGAQPTGCLDVLSRYHLADAAESMSRGNWSEAVYSAGKYMSIRDTEKQVA